jgi:hypothetical protein
MDSSKSMPPSAIVVRLRHSTSITYEAHDYIIVWKPLSKLNLKSLTSVPILVQRSAVPIVSSGSAPASSLGKRKLSYAKKDCVPRVGKRARRGPLDSYQDKTEFEKCSALLEVSEAAKQSGRFDVWACDGGDVDGTWKPRPKVLVFAKCS